MARLLLRTLALAPVLAFTLLLPIAGATAAATPKPACFKTASTQMALDQCAYTWLSNAQIRLARAIAVEKTKFAPRLVDASQSAWIAYRNAECRLDASLNVGGTIYPMTYALCEEGLTDERTTEVRAQIVGAATH